MSDPEVDAYNVRAGTQTFDGLYQFTTNTLLVETAEAIREMGSDIIKFKMSKGSKFGVPLPPAISNLTTMAQIEPSVHRVLDMPFRHYIIWAYCFAFNNEGYWRDGVTLAETNKEYAEMYNFATYLFTNYNHSGKTFCLGHWEGDWSVLGSYDPSSNPTPTAIQGMRDWLNTRQQAVDDARRNHPHAGVEVYLYTEANRVRDAMNNPTNSNQRVINMVVPYVTNLDFVSWSSYDGQGLSASSLWATLDYMESMLPTNKAGITAGKRIFVGEYGWGGSLPPSSQEPPTRTYIKNLIQWGCPYMLFWEIYNNETNKDFCLIDPLGNQTPCFDMHQRFANQARLRVAEFKQDNGRLPDSPEFAALAVPILEQPLPPPVSLALTSGPTRDIAATSARVQGTLAQGIYGEEWAQVFVFWGTQDGGTIPANWEHVVPLGTNGQFGVAAFSALLTGVAPGANYFYRFYATNSSGEAWAASSAAFRTREELQPWNFAYRMRIQLGGYDRPEPLANFPVLVVFRTNLAGFAYRQFASPRGGDLRFTDDAGLTLYHEIDEWNTNGASCVWVQVPELSSAGQTLWAYWGNPAATNLPAYATNGAVWSEGYELVWHLKEAGVPYADSVLRHPAVLGAAPAPANAGVVGRAQTFNGSSNYLDAGTVDLGNEFTLSAWVLVDNTANNIQTLFSSKAGGYSTDGLALYVNAWQTRDKRLALETGDGAQGITASTATNLVSFGQWHHVAVVVNRAAATARFYVDGLEPAQSHGILGSFGNQRGLQVGRFTDGTLCLKGLLDEVRVATQARSSNWIWASWMTVASNAAFAACQPVESTGFIVAPVTLVQPGAVWKYLDTGVDPGAAWRSNDFDDAAWKSGPAELGYGDGNESTVVSYGQDITNKYVTTYFRRAFYVPDAARVQSLGARLLRDDGAVVYLNGAEIWRDNLPTGAVSYATFASRNIAGADETNFLSKTLSPSALANGLNVLAVEIHQDRPDSSDLSFDFELTGTAIVATEPALGLAGTGNDRFLTWPGADGIFTLYTTTNLSPPVLWTRATNLPVLSNSVWTAPLSGATNSSRFYRLQSR